MRPASPDMKLTYDDFLLFPDDGKRHELIDGEHYVTPSPNTKHQRVSGNLYWLVRSYWGISAFSGFSLVFRVRGSIEWILLLQLPLAIVRLASVSESRERRSELCLAGATAGISLVLAWCLIFVARRDSAAEVLFGSDAHVRWVVPLCCLLVGYSTFLTSSGVLRGCLAFRSANLINVLAIAVVPCICLVLGRHHDIHRVVSWTGLVMAGVSALATLGVLVVGADALGLSARGITVRGLTTAIAELVAFGAPRLATLGASALFLLILPWLVARSGNVQTLAALNVMMAILGGAGIITSPAGFVLLPRFSRAVACDPHSKPRTELKVLASSTLALGLVCSLAVAGLIGTVLRVLLGSQMEVDRLLELALLIVLPMYLLVDVLRGPMDAVSKFPFNAVVYASGFIASGAAYIAQGSRVAASPRCAVALVCAYATAVSIAYWIASVKYRIRLLTGADVVAVIAWLALLGCAVWLGGGHMDTSAVARLAAGGGALTFTLAIVAWRPEWLRALLAGARR